MNRRHSCAIYSLMVWMFLTVFGCSGDEAMTPLTIQTMTNAAVAVPEMLVPAHGATLTGDSMLVQWTANGTSVTNWWLYVGNGWSSGDYYDSGLLGSGETSASLSGLPLDGRWLYLTLFYWDTGVGGQIFTNAVTAGAAPYLVSPANGSTFSSSSQTFSWSPNTAAVTEWKLYVGATCGADEIYNSGSLSAGTTSTMVTGLPTDGSTLCLTLNYFEAGVWTALYYNFTATTVVNPPSMISPAQGSTLAGSTQTFSWAANGTSVTEWWLTVGTFYGGSNVHTSGSLGLNTSYVLSALPTNGAVLFVRLWYKTGGIWKIREYSYYAFGVAPIPSMTSPTPGSTLSSATATFTWTSNGATVCDWWVYVGRQQGMSHLADSGKLGELITSFSVGGLPLDGSPLWVRLWYGCSGIWQAMDFQYSAANLTRPTMVSPAPGSTLSGTTETFTWTDNGWGSQMWWLYVGSIQSYPNYFDSGWLNHPTILSDVVTTLPTGGGLVWVRLWYKRNDTGWLYTDYQYVAAP